MIKHCYENVNSPAAFSSLKNVYREAKLRDKSVTFSNVEKFADGTTSYSLHKAVRHGKYLPTTSAGVNQEVQFDLMDTKNLFPKNNNGTNFLLICVDVYSRYLLVEPLKNKSAESTLDGIKKIFARHCYNVSISDAGKEFVCKAHKEWRTQMGIQHRVPKSLEKSALAERQIRNLRNRISRYLTHYNTKRYIHVLQSLVTGINASPNRNLKFAPAQVQRGDVFIKDSLDDFSWLKDNAVKSRLSQGNLVRLSRYRRKFEKEAKQSFSEEIFKISQVVPTHPITYYIEDLLGRPIEGHVYGWELCRVTKEDSDFKIDKIIRRKTIHGQQMALIRWRGYSKDFDSWVPSDSIHSI